MNRTIIIKTGATGDVIRTTVLLHFLKGEVYWITSAYNLSILPSQVTSLKAMASTDQVPSSWFELEFDLLINLEEEMDIARLAEKFKVKNRVGIYLEQDNIRYTPESKEWFDMSLVSTLGRTRADNLKWANRKSYQQLLLQMIGTDFRGEEYILPEIRMPGKSDSIHVAVEKHAGKRWPNKIWTGYDELVEKIILSGVSCHVLTERRSLEEYIAEISSCTHLISGDTLAMHLALGMRMPTLTVFTCTSPWEIHDYGRLLKVVSPMLEKYFYHTSPDPGASSSISVQKVYGAFQKLLNNSPNA